METNSNPLEQTKIHEDQLSISHYLNFNHTEPGTLLSHTWPGLGETAGGAPEGEEETQAQLLPHTHRWPCRAVMSCNTT